MYALQVPILLNIINVLLVRKSLGSLNFKVTEYGNSCAMKKDTTFVTLLGLLVSSCAQECGRRLNCIGLVYWSQVHMCDLIGQEVVYPARAITNQQCVYIHKTDIIFETDPCNGQCGTNQVCDEDTKTCTIKECITNDNSSLCIPCLLGNRADVGSYRIEYKSSVCIHGLTCTPAGTWQYNHETLCEHLVFRGMTGTGVDPVLAWQSGDGTVDTDTLDSNVHYRSPIIDQWEQLHIREVKFSLYKDEVEVAFIVFNGTGTSNMDWFGVDKVLRSSWTDLTEHPFHIFSIEGNGYRRLYRHIYHSIVSDQLQYNYQNGKGFS